MLRITIEACGEEAPALLGKDEAVTYLELFYVTWGEDGEGYVYADPANSTLEAAAIALAREDIHIGKHERVEVVLT